MDPGAAEKVKVQSQRSSDKYSKVIPLAVKLLLWGFAAVNIVASFSAPVSEFDDAIPLVHGILVQQGRTPHLDFPYFYPPLGLYLNAASFNLLGRSVVAARVVNAILYIAVLLLAGRFFRSRFPQFRAVVPAGVLVLAASVGTAITLASWPGFATSLVAFLTYLCFVADTGRRRYILAASGALTAVALLCRVNFGAYVAAVVVFDILLHWGFAGQERRTRAHLKTSLRDLFIYSAPLVFCIAGFCLMLYGSNVAAAISEFTVKTQAIMLQRGFVNLTFGGDFIIALTLPVCWFVFRILEGEEEFPLKTLLPAAIAILLLGVAMAGRNRPAIVGILVILQLGAVLFLHVAVRRLERTEFCMVLFSCFVFHYFISRADWFHWRLLPAIDALLLTFLVISRPEKAKSPGSSISKGTSMVLLLAAGCLLLATGEYRPWPNQFRQGVKVIASFAAEPHLADADRLFGPDRALWAELYPNANEVLALHHLRERTGSTDPIFVGVQDHSRVFFNNLRIYWLAGRPIGTRVFQLETRVATELVVQKKIIEDLEQNGVNWMIIDRQPEPGDQTFQAARYVGSNLLDEYIASHYREDARYGQYAVLTRTKS
jgi:hypothetical protein